MLRSSTRTFRNNSYQKSYTCVSLNKISRRNMVDFSYVQNLATNYYASLTVAAGLGLCAFAATRYKVAGADSYLVRTGLGIKDIKITKNKVFFGLSKSISL